MNDQGRESPSPTRLAAWKTPEVRAGACPHPAPPPGGGDRTRRGAGAEPRAPGAGGGGARRLGRASARHLLRLRSRWLSASRLPLAARLGKGSGINEAGGGPGRRWGRGGLRETPPPTAISGRRGGLALLWRRFQLENLGAVRGKTAPRQSWVAASLAKWPEPLPAASVRAFGGASPAPLAGLGRAQWWAWGRASGGEPARVFRVHRSPGMGS